MPRSPLAAEVAKAQRARDRAKALLDAEEAKLAALLGAVGKLLVATAEEEHLEEVLHNAHGNARIDTMDTQVATRGAPLETKHAGAKAIRRVDGSIAKFAVKHGEKPTTVRSWYATGEAAREIPRKYADLLAKKPYEVPLTAWRNGIRE